MLGSQVRSCNAQVDALKQELFLAEEDKHEAELQLQVRAYLLAAATLLPLDVLHMPQMRAWKQVVIQ